MNLHPRLIQRIVRVALKPGDVVVLECTERRMTAEVHARLVEAAKARLPPGVECLILEGLALKAVLAKADTVPPQAEKG